MMINYKKCWNIIINDGRRVDAMAHLFWEHVVSSSSDLFKNVYYKRRGLNN